MNFEEQKTVLVVLKLAISTFVGDLGFFSPLGSCLATSLGCSLHFQVLPFIFLFAVDICVQEFIELEI